MPGTEILVLMAWSKLEFCFMGLYFGTLIIIEKLFLQKSMIQWPKAVCYIYSLLFVVIGWVFFEFTNLTDALSYLRIMLGVGGNVLIEIQIVTKLKAYAILYLVYT
ncbi:hypothetical protein RZO55_12170 [Clostridium boliviensis]|uniref:Uncharacterized protein n=1 Tax=Clostridium boliviensis TaxID=318465 RepID=A0ABU4GMT7_9CLOT|nr:hypothetical protein [Clostridium boliviensis]MDW2798330.1 hypothetical protein [Clostridium boliviensis]